MESSIFSIAIKHFEIAEVNGCLVMTKTESRRFFELTVLGVVAAIMLYWFIGWADGNPLSDPVFMIPFSILFAIIGMGVIRLGHKETWVFDRSADRLLRNGKYLCPLSDIVRILVTHIPGFGVTMSDITLALIRRNGHKIFVDSSLNEREINTTAQAITGYIGLFPPTRETVEIKLTQFHLPWGKK